MCSWYAEVLPNPGALDKSVLGASGCLEVQGACLHKELEVVIGV